MMSNFSETIVNELQSTGTPEQAIILSQFFKTGKGQYGEGDVFIGVKVPQTRAIVKKYWKEATMRDIAELIASPLHEVRLAALLILSAQFSHWKQIAKKNSIKIEDNRTELTSEEWKTKYIAVSAENKMRDCVEFYLTHTRFINNWDLVDLSCGEILGEWLLNRERGVLFTLAGSRNLWEQRISIVTCIRLVKHGEFKECIEISERLLYHPHDLIQKAVGWTLRELGKVNRELLDRFLEQYAATMPRTTLRYSIEKHSEYERKFWMQRGRVTTS